MPLEDATKVSELVETNPLGSDPIGQGDDHIRLIKKVLKNDVLTKRLNPATIEDWQNDTSAQLDDVVTTAEYSTGNGGGAKGDIVSSLTVTLNGFDIVGHSTLALAFVLRKSDYQYLEFRMFGALPSPSDNTAVFDRIIAASGETGKLIDWGFGEFLTSTPHNASACVGMISTGKAKITATYEQVGSSDKLTNSLFLVDGMDKFSANDFEVAYTGTFDTGLIGGVCGIYIINSDDVVVENIYGHDFNHSAVSVGFEGSDCLNPRIENNRFVHNRLAGGFLGNSDRALINKNFLRENGLLGDNGTGYGFAVLAGTSAKNITMTKNVTFKNVRRGLDMHSHHTALIQGNICYKDVIGGIFALTRGNAAESLTVTGNIVFCDDQTVNGVELQYAGIQMGVSGIIPTPDGIPTMIEGNNQLFNMSKDFGLTGILPENVVALSFVNGIVYTDPTQIVSSNSILRGVNFKPIALACTVGDNVDIKIHDHNIVGSTLEGIVEIDGQNGSTGRREVKGLNVNAAAINGANITTLGGFTSIDYSNNFVNETELDSVSFTDTGYEKVYKRTAALPAATPTVVFNSFIKGEIAVLNMDYVIRADEGAVLDMAAGHGVIMAGWSITPNAVIVPIYTELSNTSRTSNSGGLGASPMNPTVTVDNNTGSNIALEITMETDTASKVFIKIKSVGEIMTLTV